MTWARMTVVVVSWIGVGLVCAGCFGPSVSDPACDQGGDCPETEVAAELPLDSVEGSMDGTLAPAPISVADATEPTPINDPAQDQANPTPGSAETDPDVSFEFILLQPNVGWGNTINLLDLLDLLSDETLADILNPATENPGSFTTLEFLCLDEGFSESYCRSRYGAR